MMANLVFGHSLATFVDRRGVGEADRDDRVVARRGQQLAAAASLSVSVSPCVASSSLASMLEVRLGLVQAARRRSR